MPFRFGYLDPDTRMNVRHRLLLGRSKHVMLDASGRVSYHDRLSEARSRKYTPAFRVLVIDGETDCVYGEVHDRLTAAVILSTVGRAWHLKEQHPMRGLPDVIEVAKPSPTNHLAPVHRALRELGIQTAPLPSGFAAGVHVYKGFDERVRDVLWNTKAKWLDLAFFQTVSAPLSAAVYPWEGSHSAWKRVSPPPPAFYDRLRAIVGKDLFAEPFQFVVTTLPR